jgi:hypothetical protein
MTTAHLALADLSPEEAEQLEDLTEQLITALLAQLARDPAHLATPSGGLTLPCPLAEFHAGPAIAARLIAEAEETLAPVPRE